MTVAAGMEADAVVDALAAIGATHVVTVPDTHQRTVLESLDRRQDLPVVRAATEDDVLGICGGLWIGGRRPVALVQQLGLFASVNALRGITHDLRLPLSILAGMYGRDVDVDVEASPNSAVRMCRPVLDALEIPSLLVEDASQLPEMTEWLQRPFEAGGTRVVLLGAPTT